jgi:hypothetical protein
MAVIADLLRYLVHRKKLVLIPIIFIMLIFGSLMFIAQGTAVGPFIYAIF